MKQLKALSKPFPDKLIEQKQGHDYVSHSAVTERALLILGTFSFDVSQLIYEPDGILSGALVTVRCEVDGKPVSITEAGECSNPTSKTNGARAKDAISDAIKRCFMRLGLGLHLWSQKDYFLDKVLERDYPSEKPKAA